MELVSDLHLHSKYSRACSKDLVPEVIAKWARMKGVHLVGTGDFTHPLWLKELKEKLEPLGNGFYQLKPQFRDTEAGGGGPFFLLSSELSCIYSKNGKVRRIHLLLLAPSFEVVDKINVQLGWIGNLRSDGRPILGIDAKEVVKIALTSSPDAVVIPAHIWTPWFSLFGSMSGFDTVQECFEEYTPQILAIETGLSSDPAMNWRLSQLDQISIVSFSDAHSPRTNKFGRELTVFRLSEPTFAHMRRALDRRNPDPDNTIAATVEFYPEEGKYHYDGHRDCKVSYAPEETVRRGGLCAVCGKKVTVGVMHRVGQLADRPEGYKPSDRPLFYSAIPLSEIIAESIGGHGVWTKAVDTYYHGLIETFGDELRVLRETSAKEIEAASLPEIARGVVRVREGKARVVPGYDGEFGKVRIFGEDEPKAQAAQGVLF
ncbi:MAG: endonuclease Q family protein [bacterium]|nr:endonuclease Q family protein [bacterium]MDZ4296407.1 endonuclease Q family protein [Patescibacteria group bacterium]